MNTLLYGVRKHLPQPLLRTVRNARVALWNWNRRRTCEVLWEQEWPWTSPNTWQRLVNFYSSRPNPVVFEYGSGISSFHHMRNLLALNGTCVSVEHNEEWYHRVVQELSSYCLRQRFDLIVQSSFTTVSDPKTGRLLRCGNTTMRITNGQTTCTMKLKLKPPLELFDAEDGTESEFADYISTLDEPCDVVIVDGRARKQCVKYVLTRNMLRPGGMLVLFEAWRGMEGWMGHPALTGSSNYQPEVRQMLALGGELIDGTGFDRWPGQSRRRTIGTVAFSCPAEACFLIHPGSKSVDTGDVAGRR